MEKVGLLGGTFDPVHDGHVQLALAARREFGLERMLLIPAADPPHKQDVVVTAFSHRRQMLALALAGIKGLQPCWIEGEMPLPSYTVDTVRLLQSRDQNPTVYSFVIGVDAFADILSWKEYRELLSRVGLIVARRKGFTADRALAGIAATLGYRRQQTRWQGRQGLRDIHFLQASPPDVSSSHIRSLLAARRADIDDMHPAVIGYALDHGLYRS
ncbi:MAG: nicotinate (nicotinamide) nucleotide adenylyltransferase [Desulfopila sp.]